MRNKLLAAIAAGGILAGGGATAVLAATSGTGAGPATTVAATVTPPITPPMLAANGPMAVVLPRLVRAGIITQAQADAVKAAMTAEMKEHWRDSGLCRLGSGGGYGRQMMGGQMMGGQIAPRWTGQTP